LIVAGQRGEIELWAQLPCPSGPPNKASPRSVSGRPWPSRVAANWSKRETGGRP